MYDFWQKQTPDAPLFPDIEWTKPEQKSHAGRLLIIGGNSLGFSAVASAYDVATKLGAGKVRAMIPDVLKKSLPATMLDVVFIPSNPSGGVSKKAEPEMQAGAAWADHILLIGDAGRNSESAMLYEQILSTDTPLTITRDAFDLLIGVANELVNRENTTVVISFAQLQKLFKSVYFPKILSFSMQLNLLVDILHKFTLSYPITVVTYHQNQLLVAHGGRVVSQENQDPMRIWRGSVATAAATYLLWTPKKPVEAITASFL